MPKSFTFDGVNSLDKHLVIEHAPKFETTTKDISFVDVEGNRSFNSYSPLTGLKMYDKHYDVAYIASSPDSYYVEMRDIAMWLIGLSGRDDGTKMYKPILTDDYEPDIYQYATFSGPLDLSNIIRQGGRGQLTFHVDPKRHFFSGDQYVNMPNGVTKTFTNNYMPASPIIELKVENNQTGTVYIEHNVSGSPSTVISVSITPSNCHNMIIDTERMIAYDADTHVLANSQVTYVDYRTIKLPNGESTMEVYTSGVGINHAYVYPKWWTI